MRVHGRTLRIDEGTLESFRASMARRAVMVAYTTTEGEETIALAVDDFMRAVMPYSLLDNMADARDNGYDLVCVECGCGIYDENDLHDERCPRRENHEPHGA